jgi:hypothetical protein
MPKAKPEEAPNGMALDPVIDAMLEHLPPPGDYWPKEDRKLWLQMIELAFELVYDDEPMQGTASEPGHGG